MRKIFLLSLIILFTSTYACADFYVYVDKGTNEIKKIVNDKKAVFLSQEDAGQLSVVTMVGDIKDYPMQYQWEDYKLIDKTFVVNTQKLSDKSNKVTALKKKKDEMDLIKDRLYKDVCLKLESEGVVFKEIKCDDF